MNITVILCTYNRCSRLARSLESTMALELPPSIEWEILVVDNNSTDQTRKVVEDYMQRSPRRFRYLFEPKQGKSHALNSGIRAAHGELLAFMDDDVTVEPTWLQNLTAGLHDGESAGAGGRILPGWMGAVPHWLPIAGPYAAGPLVLFDQGPVAKRLMEPPFGTNMAFHRGVFEKYGGFRTDLGPCPGTEVRNEDTAFGRQLLAGGEKLRYEPSAVVFHAVPTNRLQKKYFLDWWFDKARGDIREAGKPSAAVWCVAGVPLSAFRRLVVWTLRWMIAFGARPRFECKLKVWLNAGVIAEYRCLSRDAQRLRMQADADSVVRTNLVAPLSQVSTEQTARSRNGLG